MFETVLNFLKENWPIILAWIGLLVGVYLRGITREQVAKILGDVVALVEKALLAGVADTPHDLIIFYADQVYDALDALLAKLPAASVIIPIYKLYVSREKFELFALNAWHKYVERKEMALASVTTK